MRTFTVAALLVSSALAAVGCSGDASTSTPGSRAADGAVASVADDRTPAAPSSTGSPPGEAVGTIATSGVPGIDSADRFCRSWSEFAGSFQALAFASAVGNDPLAASRLEVIASGALHDAIVALDESFPEVVVTERTVFVDGLLGPFSRRSEGARRALLEAGLSEDDVAALGEAWLSELAAAGVNDPDLRVDVPVAMRPAVDRAVTAFASSVPSIGADPDLVTDASAPGTELYIAANCPDQGILGGGDVSD